ncbi:MAG: hypothetical protein HZB33_03810 [Nitrospirae bacterium]|nr:hypothetical protein [Nitrospirota bacterium]
MSSLLFVEKPRSVLLIGLGGCSLVHFLLRTFPGCTLDVVEIRKEVIELAYEYFLLPKWNPNLSIFHAAGQDFMGQQGMGRRPYDLIIVDAFDDGGPASALLSAPFLSGCRAALKEGGVCVMNLWHRPKDDFPGMYAGFHEAFMGNTLKLFPDERGWNVIVLGFGRTVDTAALASYRRRAGALERTYQINLPKFFRYICLQNFG